jgi:septal ring factor EnvC (AmiA/AmiB activator)
LDIQILQIVIAIICALLGAIIGVMTYNRNRDKDVRNDASESAVIRTKLDTISSGIDNIRIDIKANERRLSELTERVIRIDESNKQAHKRIDKIETKGGSSE